MTSLTTEDFPYTLSYVMELLHVEERDLMPFIQALNLSPRQDDKTGRLIFSHRDVDTLKKALEMRKHGEEMSTIVRLLARPAAVPSPQAPAETLSYSRHATQPTQLQTRASLAPGKDNITTMVEAVSQVKEGILKDLSRLLDDKLSGLDEVVVELIRCKSENDSLKKKLEESQRAREHLEHELSRFKQVQFGFYRKQ